MMMKKITCYAVDDDEGFLLMLQDYVAKTARLEWVGSSTDPQKGLNEILKRKSDIQLVFLDVQMERLDGWDVMRQLPKDLLVVLCTSYKKFAYKAFDFRPLDFLRKPFKFSRFLNAVSLAEAALHLSPTITSHTQEYHYFFVGGGTKGKRVMVKFDDITHVKADGEVSHIHRLHEPKLTVSQRLGKLEKQLPKSQFVRVHRSHMINKGHVKETGNGKVVVWSEGADVALALGGETYINEFNRWVDAYLCK